MSEFEERTGDRVRFRIIDDDLYLANEIHGFLEGDDGADVYMSGPVLLWEHLAAGFVEPLDEYVNDASTAYDPGDFCESLLRNNRWTGRFGDRLGSGPLLEIPVNCESYNLVYAHDVLERCGVEVPTTWEAYFVAAGQIVEKTNGAIRGFGQRGYDDWHTMFTGYATQFWSYGGSDFDESGRCAIASPQGIRATQDLVDALKASGPSDWLNTKWYPLAMDFAKGKYGLLVDSDHYVAYFENPEYSQLVGKIGYALPPASLDGNVRSNLWTWSMVMNARSRDKKTAWRFMEWATSREFLLRSTFEGNMDPTRTSIWDDARFIEYSKDWGDFYEVARDLIENKAEVLVTPAANWAELGHRWTKALRAAFQGEATVAEALEKAALDIDRLVRK